MKTTCLFKLEKITPGALRYKQVRQDDKDVNPEGPADAQGLIGTLYVRKAHVEGQPATITVTVET